MSHIATAPSRGRAAFGAMRQTHHPSELDDYPGEHRHEQHDRAESEDPASRHEQQPTQVRFSGINLSYDERGYMGVMQFDDVAVRPNEHGSYKPQIHSSIRSLDPSEVPSAHEMYREDGGRRPSSYIGGRMSPSRVRPNYKPSALRWPFLVLLLLTVLSFIGLLVYAMYALPHREKGMEFVTRRSQVDLVGRADDDSPGVISIISGPGNSESTPTNVDGETASDNPPSVSTPTQSGPITVPTRPSDDYGDISVTQPDPTMTRPTDDYGDISDTEATPTTRPVDDYGDVSVTEPISTPSRSIDDFGDIPATTPTPASTPAPDDFGDINPETTVVTIKPTDHSGGEVVQTLLLTPTFAVKTDPNGKPTTTVTGYPSFTAVIQTAQTTVLTDWRGQPTHTAVSDVLVAPFITTYTDSNGIPTATSTGYDVIPTGDPEKAIAPPYSTTYGKYFIGMFLPTVLAVVISIPVRILDLNARIFQPWHELTRSGGVSGRRSLCLETGGWQGIVNSIRWIFGGQVLIVITSLLVLASSLLVPLSAEAIAFDLQGNCVKGSGKGKGCLYVVSVSDEAVVVTIVLLAVMAILVLVLLAFLARWRSGVGTNPWSICGIASLSLNEDVRRLFPNLPDDGSDVGKTPYGLLSSILKDRCFALGYFRNSNGSLEYGITLQAGYGAGQALGKGEGGDGNGNLSPLDEALWHGGQPHHSTKQKHNQPFFMLGYTGRGLLLLVLCALLGLILYYNNTGGETEFEHFMMSESFGVRFLFTGVGFIITLCWSSFFNSKFSLPCPSTCLVNRVGD